MKRYKKYLVAGLTIIFLGIMVVSCRKVSYDYIDGKNPDERSSEFMEGIRNKLISAESGWVGYMYIPSNKKGFTFYMQFKEKNRVTMYADFADSTMVKPKESSFSIRNTGIPSLIFDTYNYIHLPADPTGSVSGGPNGAGQSSDFEYSILRATDDSIILRGNLKNCDLILVKISAKQLAEVQQGKLAQTVNSFMDFFTSKENNYLVPAGSPDSKLGISLTHNSRQVSYQILESDGSVKSYSGTYYYTVDGLKFSNDFIYGEIQFVRAEIRNGVVFLIDSNNKEYELRQSPTPLTPLAASFGFKETYKKIHIEGDKLPAGVTSGWNTIFGDMVTRFANASKRTILYMNFELQNSVKARVTIRYASSSGSQFTADAEFDYVINNDIITLSNYVPSISNANWNTRSKEIGAVADYFQNGPFKIDWVAGSGQEVIGGLYPVNKPADFYYGLLQ